MTFARVFGWFVLFPGGLFLTSVDFLLGLIVLNLGVLFPFFFKNSEAPNPAEKEALNKIRTLGTPSPAPPPVASPGGRPKETPAKEEEPRGLDVWPIPETELRFSYKDRAGDVSTRTVVFKKFLDFSTSQAWGYCHLRQGNRTFRLEGMTDVVQVETGELIPTEDLPEFLADRTSTRGYEFRDKVAELLDFMPVAEMGERQLVKLEAFATKALEANISENTKVSMLKVLTDIDLKRGLPDRALARLLPYQDNAEILRRLGEISEAQDKVAQAINYYEKALALNPKIGVTKRLKALKRA